MSQENKNYEITAFFHPTIYLKVQKDLRTFESVEQLFDHYLTTSMLEEMQCLCFLTRLNLTDFDRLNFPDQYNIELDE